MQTKKVEPFSFIYFFFFWCKSKKFNKAIHSFTVDPTSPFSDWRKAARGAVQTCQNQKGLQWV